MLYTKPSQRRTPMFNRFDAFPDNDYFSYFCPTPRLFPLYVCAHYPPHTVAQRHSHNCFALHGCVQGPLTLQTEAGDVHLEEGDFYLVPAGLRHNWRNDGPFTGAVMAILIDLTAMEHWPEESGVESCCGQLAPLVTDLHRFSTSQDSELRRSYWHAADHLIEEEPCEPILTAGLLLTLMGQLHDRMSERTRNSPPPLTDIAREIHRLLYNRVHDRLDIPHIAGHVGVSPTRAKRAFQVAYGCGIMTYFNHLKILKAKRLLCDPSLSVEQVSHSLCFANPGYFSRVFTQQTGSTPSDFRRLSQAGEPE